MQSEKLRPYFLIILLLGAALLTALVFAPFLKPLALALAFAVVLQAPYRVIARMFGSYTSIAALMTVIAGVFLILLPLSLVGVLVGNEAGNLYSSLGTTNGQSVVAQLFVRADEAVSSVMPTLGGFSQNASINIDAYAKDVLQWIVQNAGMIFSGVSSLLLAAFIFFIALYYLLRDGKLARKMFIDLSPLGERGNERILARLEQTINSVIRGSLVIALLQGILTTIGFTIFGVPNAMLWGTVAALAALIPGIGTALVFIPAITILFFVEAFVPAIGLLIWGFFAVGLIDNFLAPKLVGRGMQIHPLLVLLAVLGGIIYFGPIGIFLGPLSLSFLFALLSIYEDDTRAI